MNTSLFRAFFLALFYLALAAPHASAQRDDALEGEARALFQVGVSAFDGARYEEALHYFQLSYEKSGRPQLLYNIASAADRARQDALALESYRAFLAQVPETELRTRVEARIKKLETDLATAQAAEEARAEEARRVADAEARATVEEPQPAPGKPSKGSKAIGFATLGAGVAAMGVGGAFLAMGLSDKSTVESPTDGELWAERAEAANERGPRRLTTGLVLLPAGAALAVVGAVLAVKKPKSGDGVSLRVGPTSFMLQGSF